MSSGVANAQVLINQDNAIAGIDSNDAPGFPVTISEPGSYRLSSNLNTGGQSGIVILVSDVTIDLNGFSIRGNAGLRVGIFADNRINHNLVGIVIRNGTISNFRDGIDLGLSTQSIVERIGVHDNESFGILVGENSTVTGNTASGNGRAGISVGNSSTVTGNTASNNFVGIEVQRDSTVSGNTASGNVGQEGIGLECPVNLLGNTALRNRGTDILEFPGLGNCTRNLNTPAP